jgi:hypothetical protein
LFLTAEECVEALENQKLRKIDDLPGTVGMYGLTDHLGDIHYIGITAAGSFRDRIYSRHVNGSEERSHKLACNYNIGRMWRDRKSADYVPHEAKIAKDLRREFIRRHCLAACVPLNGTKQALETLEKEIFAIVPPDMISWNATTTSSRSDRWTPGRRVTRSGSFTRRPLENQISTSIHRKAAILLPTG